MIRVRFLFQPEENGTWAVSSIFLNEKSVGEDRMEKKFKCFNSSEYGIYALNKNSANVPRFIHFIQILNVTLLDFRNGVLTDRIDASNFFLLLFNMFIPLVDYGYPKYPEE